MNHIDFPRDVSDSIIIDDVQPIALCPDMHGQFLWTWPNFVVTAWDRTNQREAEFELEATLRKMSGVGFSVNDSLLWYSIWDNPLDAPLRDKTPWELVGPRKFDFTKPNERWYELFRSYLMIHHMVGIEAEMQYMMRDRYQIYPYRHNVNNIEARHLWDPIVFEKTAIMIKKHLDIYTDVYSMDEPSEYYPWLKIANEWEHKGDGNTFDTIGKFHQDMYEQVIKYYTNLDRLCVDVHKSEGTINYLKYNKEPCPKCNQIHGKKEYDRLAVPEFHQFSTEQDFGSHDFLAGKDKVRKCTDDGGSLTDTGDGLSIGHRTWADKEQVEDAARYAWTRAKKKRKRVIIGYMVPEIWPVGANGKITDFPYFTQEDINWERFEGLHDIWKEIYA